MTDGDPRSAEPSRMRTRLSPHTRAGPAAAPSTPTPQPKRKRRRFGSMSPSWPGFRRAFTGLDRTAGGKFREGLFLAGGLLGDDLVLDALVGRLGHELLRDQLVLSLVRAVLDDLFRVGLPDAGQRLQLVGRGRVEVEESAFLFLGLGISLGRGSGGSTLLGLGPSVRGAQESPGNHRDREQSDQSVEHVCPPCRGTLWRKGTTVKHCLSAILSA